MVTDGALAQRIQHVGNHLHIEPVPTKLTANSVKIATQQAIYPLQYAYLYVSNALLRRKLDIFHVQATDQYQSLQYVFREPLVDYVTYRRLLAYLTHWAATTTPGVERHFWERDWDDDFLATFEQAVHVWTTGIEELAEIGGVTISPYSQVVDVNSYAAGDKVSVNPPYHQLQPLSPILIIDTQATTL
ncbi:MAG: hypothetical protein Q9218_003431 [Villophora microphyllina]